MKVAFHTLGCKVNQYETEALALKFKEKGYEVADENDFADIYIINTCTVTGLADRKSRQYIRRMKKLNPGSIIAVTGCYAQISPEEVSAIEEVDIVTGTNEKNNLVDYIEDFLREETAQVHVRGYEELDVYEETGSVTMIESRTRAYIKVQEGCNRFCSYCIIPYARGKVRSRAVEDVVAEAKGLIQRGFKELVLTGINTALYGTEPDFPPQTDGLVGIEIIIKELNDLQGKFRIRLSSLEPTVVNEDYVKRLLKYERLCHHLHLSVQSGSNDILKEMNRPYTRDDYLNIVHALKGFDPDYGITTDLIVGFPGESETNFQDSIDIIKKAGFCKVHGFKYSKRPLTKAAAMCEQIPAPVKKQRMEKLIEAGDAAARTFFKRNEGKTRQVLFEEYLDDTGCITGYTDNYIKVYVKTEDQTLLNQLVDVVLGEGFLDGVLGRVE